MEWFFGLLEVVDVGIPGYPIFEDRGALIGLLEVSAVAVEVVLVLDGFEEFIIRYGG